jgi:hypothetical protein
MKLQKIKPLFEFFNEQMPEVFVTNFADYLALPKRMGLYSIWQDDRCIYVGKGKIPDRFKHHWNKANEIWLTGKGTRNGTQDPLGWQDLRSQDWFNPKIWTVEYFLEDSFVNQAAYEGSMIKLLNPYANDESYADRVAKQLTESK